MIIFQGQRCDCNKLVFYLLLLNCSQKCQYQRHIITVVLKSIYRETNIIEVHPRRQLLVRWQYWLMNHIKKQQLERWQTEAACFICDNGNGLSFIAGMFRKHAYNYVYNWKMSKFQANVQCVCFIVLLTKKKELKISLPWWHIYYAFNHELKASVFLLHLMKLKH